VLHTNELYDKFVCGLCHMPARAGKGAHAMAAAAADQELH
jgi:hypothetical protein